MQFSIQQGSVRSLNAISASIGVCVVFQMQIHYKKMDPERGREFAVVAVKLGKKIFFRICSPSPPNDRALVRPRQIWRFSKFFFLILIFNFLIFFFYICTPLRRKTTHLRVQFFCNVVAWIKYIIIALESVLWFFIFYYTSEENWTCCTPNTIKEW